MEALARQLVKKRVAWFVVVVTLLVAALAGHQAMGVDRDDDPVEIGRAVGQAGREHFGGPERAFGIGQQHAFELLAPLPRAGVAALHLVEEPVDPTVKETNLEDRELGEHVLALIRSLPESYRETLVLRLVEGLTGPEIAERTGMTHGSVRVNLSRGMAQLRPLLAKKGWS